MNKKNIFPLLIIFILTLLSCNENESNIPENLIGTWIGISHESRGTAYLTIRFNEDQTGELLLESPTGAYTFASFQYSLTGLQIQCKGASAGTIGQGTNNNFKMTLNLDNEHLIPLNQYTQFILTKDGSIETDSNGNIIKAKANSSETC